MKELGNPKAPLAMLLCTDRGCKLNRNHTSVNRTAEDGWWLKNDIEVHEGLNPTHETVVVNVYEDFPITKSDADTVLQLTGVKIPPELVEKK